MTWLWVYHSRCQHVSLWYARTYADCVLVLSATVLCTVDGM